MPFKSKAQQRYMFSQHPEVAREMADKMKEEKKSFKALPEKVEKKAEELPFWLQLGLAKVAEAQGVEKVGMLSKVAQGSFGNPYAGHPFALQAQRLQQAYRSQGQEQPQEIPQEAIQARFPERQDAVAAPPMTITPAEAAQMGRDATISGRAAGLVGGGVGGYQLGGLVGNRLGRYGVLGRIAGTGLGAGLGALAGGLGANTAMRKLVEPSIRQPEEQIDYSDPRVLEYLSQFQGGY